MKTNKKGWMVALACMVLIGASGSVFAQRGDSYRNGKGRDHGDGKYASARHDSKKSFSNKIYRITEADSLQEIKMKPIVDRASKRLESLQMSYQKQEKRVMDSLSIQLKPILKEDQMKRLDDFNYHAQDRARMR